MQKLHVLVVVLVYVLAGCAQQTDKTAGNSSVAAAVNGVEITKSQVEYQYSHSARKKMSGQEATNMKRRILGCLIKTELFAEKARSMKLDQSKNYVQERYSCEKTALAKLALNELAVKKSVFSDKEADDFVRNNPDLFAKRKLYYYGDLLMSGADKLFLESLDAMIETRRGA